MNAVYRQSCPLRSSDADFSGRLAIGPLIQMLTDAAWAHVHGQQLGYQHLSQTRRTWVNTSLRLELVQQPNWQQSGQVTVETWLARRDRFYWLRDFRLYDTAGLEFAQASTTSIVLDLESRRPYLKDDLSPPPLFADLPPVFSGANDKLPSLPSRAQAGAEARAEARAAQGRPEWQEQLRFVVQLADLDSNQHASNARYAEWLVNSYELDFYQCYQVASIQLQYLKEALWGQELTLLRQQPQTGDPKTLQHDFCLCWQDRELLRSRLCWRANSEENSG